MPYDIEAFFGDNTPYLMTVEEAIDLFASFDETWTYEIIENFLRDLRNYVRRYGE